MCVLGEPTEGKVVVGHFGRSGSGSRRRQLHPHRVHRGEARPELDPAHARGARRRARVDPARRAIPRTPTAALRRSSTSRDAGRLRLARVTDAASHRPFPRRRVPPTKPMPVARRQVLDFVRDLRRGPDYGVEGEVYVTAPGAEIAEDLRSSRAIEGAHEQKFARDPNHDVTRWFSDASSSPATGSRPSTTAPRRDSSTRSRARTSRSTVSSRRRRSTRLSPPRCAGWPNEPLLASREPAGAGGRRSVRQPPRDGAAGADARLVARPDRPRRARRRSADPLRLSPHGPARPADARRTGTRFREREGVRPSRARSATTPASSPRAVPPWPDSPCRRSRSRSSSPLASTCRSR